VVKGSAKRLMPNKDALLRVPRGDGQSDRGLERFTAIVASPAND
jgi:hypothetical protein